LTLTLAITGGTGFVGGHLIRAALAQGHSVRALARRDPPAVATEGSDRLVWVRGALDEPSRLDELVAGTDAVIHVAGVINGRTAADFVAGNLGGTEAMADAACRQGVRRFIQLSSLAARRPRLSSYGASKAQADAAVRRSKLDWTILRPPAVYGPGDRETLLLFQMVDRGLAVLPGRGRFSMLEVTDLARALLALVSAPASHKMTLEIDDGTPGGLDHRTLAILIGKAIGKRPILLPVPAATLRLGALLDTAAAKVARRQPRLSFDRARYLAHSDWTARTGQMTALGIWEPLWQAEAGLKRAADWYREHGWLKG
jgi:nucleoside-diphosphate-sugar epimerase